MEARIAEEAERARHYLDPSTESRITKVRTQIMILKIMLCYCLFEYANFLLLVDLVKLTILIKIDPFILFLMPSLFMLFTICR